MTIVKSCEVADFDRLLSTMAFTDESNHRSEDALWVMMEDIKILPETDKRLLESTGKYATETFVVVIVVGVHIIG